MAPKKRAAFVQPAELTAASSREDVEIWVESRLPADIAKNLISHWREAGELFDGDTLLSADEQLLIETGCSRTVARKLVALVQQEQTSKRQRTAEEAEEEEDTVEVQLPNQQAQGQASRGRRVSRRLHSQPPKEEAEHSVAMQEGQTEEEEEDDQEEQQQQQQQEPDSQGEEEPEAGSSDHAALPDHAMPLSTGRAIRRQSRRQQAAGGSEAPRMLTRRQRRQMESESPEQQQREQQEQQGQGQGVQGDEEERQQAGGARRRGGRQSRISAIHTVVRPSQPVPAARPAAAREQDAQQQQAGMQQVGAGDRPEQQQQQEPDGPLVTVDLGLAAESRQYVYDWEGRFWQYFEELGLHFLGVPGLTQVVEELEEDWEEIAAYCLKEFKKVEGTRRWVAHKRPEKIMKKLIKLLQTGHPEGRPNEGGGMSQEGLRELLELDCCADAVREYVEQRLAPRLQNAPEVEQPLDLFWEVVKVPVGRVLPEAQMLWGTRKFKYVRIDGQAASAVEPGTSNSVDWREVWAGIVSGDLVLEKQEEHFDWLQEVDKLRYNRQFQVIARLERSAGKGNLRVFLYQVLDDLGSGVVSAPMRQQDEDGDYEAILGADLALVISQLDHLRAAVAKTQRKVRSKGLPCVLPANEPLGKAQFDSAIKPLIEEADRPEPEGFEELCDNSFLLKLAPHQRKAVAHMLEKERTGTAADLWVQLTPPAQPGLHWYVSPVLQQSRVFTSKIQAEQWVHAKGGAGSISLEVGMGKTACAIAAVQLNPPPQGWRLNRAFQTPRAEDHMAAAVNNMPHGGTLIVVPTAIVTQWCAEVRKTTSKRLLVFKWVDGTKKSPLLHDARILARYDVVLTDMNTVKQAANLSTINSIFWHRVVVDEAQQPQCACLLNNRDLFATNRWVLTGTPNNSNNLDSMAAQYAFLKLGPFGVLHTHMPAALAHMLKSTMVFYSKGGQLDGRRPNLELPPLKEKVLECEMSVEDAAWYRRLQDEQRSKFRNLLIQNFIDPDNMEDTSFHHEPAEQVMSRHMNKLRPIIGPLRQAASSAFKQPTGQTLYDAAKGRYYNETRQYTSKVEAVLEVLRQKGAREKVVIFSEFPLLLKAVKDRLPELELESRDLMGSSKSDKRGQAIDDFQTAPPTQVLLCPHRTGGAGVTLTAGTHVILCEPLLNPTFEEQAIGRCNRFGQKVSVTVTRLVMKGTIEEKVVELMREVTGGGEALVDRSSKLTLDDLHWMVHQQEDEEMGDS